MLKTNIKLVSCNFEVDDKEVTMKKKGKKVKPTAVLSYSSRNFSGTKTFIPKQQFAELHTAAATLFSVMDRMRGIKKHVTGDKRQQELFTKEVKNHDENHQG